MATEIERKYLLARPPDLEAIAAAGDVDTVEIEQRYLDAPPGVERRVRRQRYGDGRTTYVLTEKRAVPGTSLEREESERTISAAGYEAAVEGTTGAPIRKRRHRFTCDGQRFELDEFLEPVQAWLLEIELAAGDVEVRLPELLAVDREVTDDPAWRNAAIAAKGAG